ncbi:MAG: hypothetical protein LBL96_10860 [Clostridiales bacterium]|jgi:hypothetical protein|nr:hypothetical protein [Clostridiales bacterium]
MAITSRTIIFSIFFLLVVGVGGILLQIFLSKKEGKWAGLILPIITFCASFIYLLNVANIGELSSVIMTIVSVFLLGNIPTVVLLGIYAVCKERRKKRRDLEKMSVQDLE